MISPTKKRQVEREKVVPPIQLAAHENCAKYIRELLDVYAKHGVKESIAWEVIYLRLEFNDASAEVE